MSKTSLSQRPFNGANGNVISARLPQDYYNFEDSHVTSTTSTGRPCIQVVPASEDLGEVSDFQLSALLAAGINPQFVSTGIGSPVDGISQLVDFANSNPEITE